MENNDNIESLELETKTVKTIDPNSKIFVQTYTGDEDYNINNISKKYAEVEEGEYIRVETNEKTGEEVVIPNSEIFIWSYIDESAGLNISTVGDKSGPPKEGTYVQIKYEKITVIKSSKTEIQPENNSEDVLSEEEKQIKENREKKEKAKRKVKQAIAAVIIPIVIATGAKSCASNKKPEQQEVPTNVETQITEEQIYDMIEQADKALANIRDVVRNSEMQPAAIEDDQTLLGQEVTHTVQEGNELIIKGNELANDCEEFVEKTSSDEAITYDEATQYLDEGLDILDRVQEFYENDQELMETHLATNNEIEEKGLRTEATHHEGENTAGQIEYRKKQIENIKEVKNEFAKVQAALVDTNSYDYDATVSNKDKINNNIQSSNERGAK